MTAVHDSPGTDAEPAPPLEAQPRRFSTFRLVAVALVTALVAVLGALWIVQSRSSAPAEWSADAGFARDMQTHHAQAVEMAFLARDRSSDPELRTVAYDIITSQQQQAGQMYGWLVQWGLPQTGSRPPMAWVGEEHAEAHSSADGTMPGLATKEQLDELRDATGVEAERLFLALMIAHHEGGVAMAEAALAEARTPEVKTLAGAIASAQASEIELLQRMLADRG